MQLSNEGKKKFIEFLKTLSYEEIMRSFANILLEINDGYNYGFIHPNESYLIFEISYAEISYSVFYGNGFPTDDPDIDEGIIARYEGVEL